MNGEKLYLVKQAVLFVIDNLSSCDRLSIVSFSTNAKRILRLTRMTDIGRQAAKQAVNMLVATAATDIVKGLKKGVQVLEERREKNPIASIIILSDGNDNCNGGSFSRKGEEPRYLHLLPASVRPRNETAMEDSKQQTFPVHAFGFGSDHDPIAMHAIADSSGGTFSFIESFVMVQDAFASCIGGLLTVVIQDLKLTARAASHGIEIKSIPSGRYVSNISNQGSDGVIIVGDMYAEEEREFLFYLSIPKLLTMENGDKMSILDITCRYKDAVSEEMVEIQADLLEIRRPDFLSPVDTVVSMEVDRHRNRLLVSESIAEAQRKADSRDLTGAQAVLSNVRSTIVQSVSGQAGDKFCAWLECEIMEAEQKMANMRLYEESGRAFLMAGKSAHASQRAGGVAVRKRLTGAVASNMKLGMEAMGDSSDSDDDMGCSLYDDDCNMAYAGGYATRFMEDMVQKSKRATQTITKNADVVNKSPQVEETTTKDCGSSSDEDDDNDVDTGFSIQVAQTITKDETDEDDSDDYMELFSLF